ncbi:Hepatocellular carcinoma-associated antigen 59 [Kalmanozyma brasiliensis GHG001]|uniref:Hepatocellular carcinoma-associated antigen 59 domain-containing protein n=1 Tax=Kalmanozyma brasiliensis (strain GHG001) TaxID=1365824 RepID=V5EQ68_KALBG|nr:Hepatocellular carcinoma-associated antigen 59 [Kalmanozyma brasiliensis GHG001]EST07280.1 Hepatocellular carcinoma-associated antigen 59 [Kalmanozyma brasiliensis GHG001]
MSSPEAGSSKAPAQTSPPPLLFKKRGKANNASRIFSTAIDDPSPSTTDNTTTTQTDATHTEKDEVSVQDLIALRSLTRKPTGTELERLNNGERRKKSRQKDKSAAQLEEERWGQQMKNGGLMAGASSSTAAANDNDESDEDDASKPRRLVRKNNFQGETGTVDVDKHMMAYIEQEMNKRTGHASLDSSSAAVQKAIHDPQDQLYAVAEKYRQLQRSIKPEQSQEEREGNVALSAAMLSSIPEVDLGIDTRMKNIEDTERAKRLLQEKNKSGGAGRVSAADQAYANARFQQQRQATDKSDFPTARESQGREERKQTATDHLVLDRFKKRQRNFR